MNTAVSKVPHPNRERIELDDIRVGKDVIEIVTSGMYVSPVTVFREYVQNAAIRSTWPVRTVSCRHTNEAE